MRPRYLAGHLVLGHQHRQGRLARRAERSTSWSAGRHEPDAVHANVHTGGYNHTRGNGRGQRLALPNAEQDHHVYREAWTKDRLVFSVGGREFFTCKNDGTGVDAWLFDGPHYLILNLAIGGNWGGAQRVDPGVFPQRFLIDYVRFYQQR